MPDIRFDSARARGLVREPPAAKPSPGAQVQAALSSSRSAPAPHSLGDVVRAPLDAAGHVVGCIVGKPVKMAQQWVKDTLSKLNVYSNVDKLKNVGDNYTIHATGSVFAGPGAAGEVSLNVELVAPGVYQLRVGGQFGPELWVGFGPPKEIKPGDDGAFVEALAEASAKAKFGTAWEMRFDGSEGKSPPSGEIAREQVKVAITQLLLHLGHCAAAQKYVPWHESNEIIEASGDHIREWKAQGKRPTPEVQCVDLPSHLTAREFSDDLGAGAEGHAFVDFLLLRLGAFKGLNLEGKSSARFLFEQGSANKLVLEAGLQLGSDQGFDWAFSPPKPQPDGGGGDGAGDSSTVLTTISCERARTGGKGGMFSLLRHLEPAKQAVHQVRVEARRHALLHPSREQSFTYIFQGKDVPGLLDDVRRVATAKSKGERDRIIKELLDGRYLEIIDERDKLAQQTLSFSETFFPLSLAAAVQGVLTTVTSRSVSPPGASPIG